MTLTQIASILNETIVPNALGESTTIAEDLSNISTLGTALANLTVSDLKSYMGDLAVGVYYDFIRSKEFKELTYGMYINEHEYGGVMGRVRAKMTAAYDTPIATLQSYIADSSAPDYNDGHYYGAQFDVETWFKDVAFQIPASYSIEMFKKAFMSINETETMMALFRQNAENSAKFKLNELARANLRRLILSCNASRKVNLISGYNTLHGFSSGDDGFIDLTNWNLSAEFKLYCQETVINLKKYLQDANDKYNDGTLVNFSEAEDIRSTLLTAFSTALDFNQSAVYHNELTSIGDHYTINFWQNQSTVLNPVIASSSTFDEVKETVGESTTTISHVVGVIYDKYSAGITEKLNKMTEDYIAKGDFVTQYHHFIKSYFVDGRESAIILCLA